MELCFDNIKCSESGNGSQYACFILIHWISYWAQKPVFKGLFFWLYVIKYFLLQLN